MVLLGADRILENQGPHGLCLSLTLFFSPKGSLCSPLLFFLFFLRFYFLNEYFLNSTPKVGLELRTPRSGFTLQWLSQPGVPVPLPSSWLLQLTPSFSSIILKFAYNPSWMFPSSLFFYSWTLWLFGNFFEFPKEGQFNCLNHLLGCSKHDPTKVASVGIRNERHEPVYGLWRDECLDMNVAKAEWIKSKLDKDSSIWEKYIASEPLGLT